MDTKQRWAPLQVDFDAEAVDSFCSICVLCGHVGEFDEVDCKACERWRSMLGFAAAVDAGIVVDRKGKEGE